MAYPRLARLKTHAQFTHHLGELKLDFPCEEILENGDESVLAQPIKVHDFKIGNRFSILPMEGWDGTADGKPTDLTRRRWKNFGHSGAKLIWGGEAVAVVRVGQAARVDRGARRIIKKKKKKRKKPQKKKKNKKTKKKKKHKKTKRQER